MPCSGVPRDLREASLALGATRWQTTVRVVIPAALSGIGTAVMLGMSRAIGETMVVLMVAGGAGIIPTSLLDPVRPMPASIAAEMAEAAFRSEHYHALLPWHCALFPDAGLQSGRRIHSRETPSGGNLQPVNAQCCKVAQYDASSERGKIHVSHQPPYP